MFSAQMQVDRQMKLYSGPLSLFSRKAEIALNEKGIAFERVMVPFNQAQGYSPKHPAVLAANPKGQVPVLVDGDLTLFDSTLIFEYLEDAYPTPPLYPAEAKARRWQLGERYYFMEAGDVVERTRSLPPAERYKALAAWVLPTESRPTFQLAGVDKALDVLGIVDQGKQPDGKRVLFGSRFDAPCLEMVAAAKAAGLLDDLAERIVKAETSAADDQFRRSKAAIPASSPSAGRWSEAATNRST